MGHISAKQELLSKHDEALVESGKKIVTESIEATREYCKSMITICVGAIPTYFLIIDFLGIEFLKQEPLSPKYYLIIPPFLFLFSSLVFVFGYLPSKNNIMLDNLEDLANKRDKLITRRLNSSYIGLFLFTIATILSIIIPILN